MQSQRIACILWLMAACFSSGCGDGRAAVRGQITFDDQPVEQGAITFVPIGETKGPVTGAVITSGRYDIGASNGPLVGRYKVEIRWAKKTGKQVAEPPPAPPGTMVDVVAEAIPAIHNTESSLTADIKAGKNQLDFQLQTKPK